jgi:hypothetical protein
LAQWGKTKPSRDALKIPANTLYPPPQTITDNEVVKDNPAKKNKIKIKNKKSKKVAYLAEEEYFVTALVPSDTACFASSPGRMSLTLKKS